MILTPVRRALRSNFMDQRTQGILLVAVMIAISLMFQVQVKLLAASLTPALTKMDNWQDIAAVVTRNCLTWRAFFVVVLAGLAFILWLLALTRLELSYALPIASISIVISAVGGGLWLGEDLSWMRIVGILIIATGIGLVAYS
jgi:multidrug transporter EmrE-like cation transporter